MSDDLIRQLSSTRSKERTVVSRLSRAEQHILLKATPEVRVRLQSERTASIPYRLKAGSARYQGKIERFNLIDEALLTLEHLYLNLRLAQGLFILS